MKTILFVVALLIGVSTTQAQYLHQTDTLTVTDTAWVLVSYDKTYMKFIEVFLDSMVTGQVLFIVEGTDTSLVNRHRIPRKSKDETATVTSYTFFTTQDSLQFLVNTGEMQAIVQRKSYYGVR